MNADADRFARAIAAIDSANAEDPNLIEADGARRPAELVYGERMSEALRAFLPGAAEELRLAARGQHIRRWTSKRSDYPQGREGYLLWRGDLKRFHADSLARVMERCGYAQGSVERARFLVEKRRLKRDPDSQALEDVACLVFLEHYLEDFAAGREEGKVVGVLRKAWRKMSARGHEAALALALPERSASLLAAALEGDGPGEAG